MKWYPHLYVGEQAEKKKKRIVWRIENHKKICGVYLITLSSNGKDIFDIFSCVYLSFPAVSRNCPMIIGIAGSYWEAVDLAVAIIEDIYRETGSMQIRQYLEQKTEQSEQKRKRQR